MNHPTRLSERPSVAGKLLQAGGGRLWIKGVTYGTFAPGPDGRQFPPPSRAAADFALMREAGFNTIRTYTVPDQTVLDLAARQGLRVMVGLAWAQHVAFLDDRRAAADIRRGVRADVRAVAAHPATLLIALGNEIPASVVRWHGRERVERFLWELSDEARSVGGDDALLTYVNYPPTEYLNLPFVDLVAFNVYLHHEPALRAYLARLQSLAGNKPLLVAEAGADSLREGPDRQAALTAMQVRAAFAEGACGAVAFAFTDEWWRGGYAIDDWAFGLVDRERRPKPALAAVTRAFAGAPFPAEGPAWPSVSVVVCASNAADTIDECLTSLGRLTYPSFEIIVVNDGSRDDTGERARRHAGVTVLDVAHGGLSAARNVGLEAARGEVVAYLDADAYVEPEWLTYLVQPFLTSAAVGAGGPNVVPPGDPWMAQCVARAPGGPTQVLLDERTAEHVPGCNMAFLRDALVAIGGFNPIYLRAGDDVDACWRLQARGWTIGFSAAALVWHHHRASVRAYWRQQVGYGEGQTWLVPHHPDKFAGQKIAWRGHIYSPLPFVRALSRPRVNTGVWGTAAFPSVYHIAAYPLAFVPHMVRWQLACLALLAAGPLLAWAWGPAWRLLAAAGAAGLLVTIGRCVRYALASDIEALPPIAGWSRRISRIAYRGVITWLHVMQPFARAYGQVRGLFSPPRAAPAAAEGAGRPASASLGDLWRALYLLGRGSIESRFWSERWIAGDVLLTRLTDRLRRSPVTGNLEVDDGWQAERDVAVTIGRLAWLDLRVLVEEHGGGRHLVRIARRLRAVPACLGLLLVGLLGVAASLQDPAAFPGLAAAVGAGVAAFVAGGLVWRTATALAETDRVTAELMGDLDMQPLDRSPAKPQRGREAEPAAVADAAREEARWSA